MANAADDGSTGQAPVAPGTLPEADRIRGWPQQLIASRSASDPQMEHYRELRLQLTQRWFALGNKSLAVLSTDHEAAVGFFIANLALVFAQAHQRTLLIDGNLTSPRQDTIFNLAPGRGLSDMLASRQADDHIAPSGASDHLHILPAGTVPPNPYELLSSTAFSDLNRRLSSRFDVTLFDVPAVSLSADAMAVAMQTDGALLVASKHRTRVADVVAIERKLQNLGAKLVGSVLINI